MNAAVLVPPLTILGALFGFRELRRFAWPYFFLILAMGAFQFTMDVLTFYGQLGVGWRALQQPPLFAMYIAHTKLTCKSLCHHTGRQDISTQLTSAIGWFVVVSFLYFRALPPLWFASDTTGRILIRLFGHTLAMELIISANRMCVRQLLQFPPQVLYCVTSAPMLLAALYGRFLVTAAGSAMLTLLVSVLVSAMEIALRLTVTSRDRLYARTWAWIKATQSHFTAAGTTTRAADATVTTPPDDETTPPLAASASGAVPRLSLADMPQRKHTSGTPSARMTAYTTSARLATARGSGSAVAGGTLRDVRINVDMVPQDVIFEIMSILVAPACQWVFSGYSIRAAVVSMTIQLAVEVRA